MNVSYRWLKAIAPAIEEEPQRLAERLGLLGAPVDDMTDLSEGLGDVVIARVDAVRPHPNADRLRLCTVQAGGEALQVVCGAPNVEAGGYYPFAPVGASLPGGIQIRKAKLRGEVSEGMLCSARELGLGRDHAGLLALAGEWEPGTAFVGGIGIDDTRMVLDITPNRPDLLSHLGVARELAPGGEADLELPAFPGGPVELEIAAADGAHAETPEIGVTVEDVDGCSRYMAAVLSGVRVGPSPEWLATRLRAIGVRPINNVVDATNYVLQELGQPLHAFDLDRIAGPEIRVRRARAGETLKTLDGVDRPLDATALVIADRDAPVALAGIMGGEASEVTASTTRVLVECALFDPLDVRRTARGLGLSTDASHRFERGVDPEGQPRALRRVLELIVAVAGGTVSPTALDVRPVVPERVEVSVRPTRVRQVLGVDCDAGEIARLLRPIGFGAEAEGDAVRVAVPSFRPDVTREIDVIEEIARRRGYDNFPEQSGAFRPSRVPTDPRLGTQRALHALFERWGLLEARTVAFAPAAPDRVPLLNPLSAEESHLRDQLVEGLLRRVEHNWAHGVRAVRLYEIGTVFRPDGAVPAEEIRVAAVGTGARRPPHWSGESGAWEVWDVKALLEEVAEITGGTIAPVTAEPPPYLVAGSAFELVAEGGRRLGAAGLVDPKRIDAPAWADPVVALEVVLAAKDPEAPVTYRDLPAFPAAERDLALLTPRGVSAAQVEAVIRASAGELLEAVWPFDLYEGKGIPEDTRSVAWRLRFRHRDRTLTDQEVEAAVRTTLQALEEEHGIRRR